ncbi:hypothetical protein JCM33374_g6635 [Metschnikowia sp. JCM 33374]|nr:hypothetical protein JCM33374_g3365 [Metschnikowia sp. JCM 33374]GEQ72947.1 hypothetical protein JCM33374_g6635 [Metschnikowia sp. JCM 33374]
MSQYKFPRALVEDFKDYQITPKGAPIKVNHEGYGSSNTPKEDAFYETPKDTSRILKEKMKTKYESGVGSINWAANNTKPDLAFAANALAS